VVAERVVPGATGARVRKVVARAVEQLQTVG
jgi:hypothetical protein